jgi:hypothetical protein
VARKELARAEILDCPGCFLFPPRAHRSAGRPGARTPLGGLPHTAARSPGARCAPLGRDVAMLRLSVRWVDRLPINRLVDVGKPGHVICEKAHPRVIREAEKGRCPADGATVNAFARSSRLGITDLVDHRDLSLDDTRHGCVGFASTSATLPRASSHTTSTTMSSSARRGEIDGYASTGRFCVGSQPRISASLELPQSAIAAACSTLSPPSGMVYRQLKRRPLRPHPPLLPPRPSGAS